MVLKMRERNDWFLGMMKDLYGDALSFPNLNYQNQRTKITVRCNIHNVEYAAWPTNLTQGRKSCPRCAGILTCADFIEKARKTHSLKYNYDKVRFVNTTTKVTVTCPEHGDWEVKPVVHYNDGSGCPKCALENNHLNIGSFIKKAQTVHGHIYDYSKVAISKNTDVITIKCPHHGYFDQPARAHLAGHKCKRCSINGTKHTLEKFIAMAKEIHGSTYDYSRAEYVNSKTKLTVLCKYHGEFYIKPNTHIGQRTGCPRCRESYGERLVAKYLDEFGIVFKKEFSLKDNKYRFDFYLPDYRVLIEFHGIQHYEPVERFGGLDGHLAVIRRDIAKMRLAHENNMTLIVLNHKDLSGNKLFDNLKKELIKLNIIS